MSIGAAVLQEHGSWAVPVPGPQKQAFETSRRRATPAARTLLDEDDAAVADEPPAFGVMLHLLGAVALAGAGFLWGLALLIGLAAGSGLRASFVLVGLGGGLLWLTWLIRRTASGERRTPVDRAVVGVDEAP